MQPVLGCKGTTDASPLPASTIVKKEAHSAACYHLDHSDIVAPVPPSQGASKPSAEGTLHT
jgi:hypothetical protein